MSLSHDRLLVAKGVIAFIGLVVVVSIVAIASVVACDFLEDPEYSQRHR